MTKTEDPNRMVTVHGGPAWDVELLAMQLEEAGIDCFLPDKMSKAVDPFITGANPLESRLQVRAADAVRATEIVEKARESLKPGQIEGDDFDDEYEQGEDEVEEETPRQEVEWLASRTRWLAVFGFMSCGLTLPFAILAGSFYLNASRKYGIRARAHRMTLWAFGISICALVAYVLFWWVMLTVGVILS